jgi:hypothetical protein
MEFWLEYIHRQKFNLKELLLQKKKFVLSLCQNSIYYENIRPLLLEQFKLSNIAEKGHVVLRLYSELHFTY